jgi:hypothetical protein
MPFSPCLMHCAVSSPCAIMFSLPCAIMFSWASANVMVQPCMEPLSFTSVFLRLHRYPRDQPSIWHMNSGASDPNPVARASRLAGHSALYAPAVCAHAGLVSHRGLQTALSAAARKFGTLPRPRTETEFLHRQLAEQARRVHSAPAEYTVHPLVASPTGTESSGSTSRSSVRVLCPERTVS